LRAAEGGRVTGDDHKRFLDALYGGAADVAEFERALTLLADRMSCRSASLVALDAYAPLADMVVSVGVFDEDARQRYARDFASIDPAPSAFARLPTGTVSTTDRLLSAKDLREGVFVNEFYYPLGLTETLGGNLRSDNGHFELIGLQRGRDRGAFEDSELAEIERLTPHFSRALQLRRAFLRLETRAEGLQVAVDRLSAGVVLLDASGAALFVNHAMRAIAERGHGLSLNRAGRPVPANAKARSRLDALLKDVILGGAGGIVAVPCSQGVRPFAVLVAPSPPSIAEQLRERRSTACALVIVHDPAGRQVPAPELLQQGLGLPPGAARLVAALAGEDDDLRSFAEREGVTIHAARFHLRMAFARTGARSQAELVRLAVRFLRDLGLRQPDTGQD
jgi:hypothetical protein